MALLADEDDSYDLDPVVIQRSSTNEPLFDEGGSDFQIHRPKDKKKFKLEEKRGSTRTLPWAKQKDGTLEKNKKGKHNRTKSGSRTPPDSPKSSRTEESRKLSKTGTAGQLQPSPNVKSSRKRYAQLGGLEESSDDEQGEGEEGSGYLLSNKPALDQDKAHHDNPWVSAGEKPSSPTSQAQHGNPWASAEEKPSSPKSQPQFPKLSFKAVDNQDLNQDPWWPKEMSPGRRATVQFPVLFGKQPDGQATSPEKLFVPHEGRSSMSSVQNPMFGQAVSPVREPQKNPHPLFFQSPYQPVTTLPPPPQPLAPPPQPLAPPLSQASQLTHAQTSQPQEQEKEHSIPPAAPVPSPPSEPDWSISEELREKCLSQFTDLNPSGGLLQGDKAREFFVLSKLPNQELSAIWRMADINKDNALSEYEFCVAMKLVMMRRKGCEIPTSLPSVLLPTTIPSSFSDNFWPTDSQPAPTTSSSDDQPQEELTEGGATTPKEDNSDFLLRAESGIVMNPIDDEVLVEIGDTQNNDTGLLVDISDESEPRDEPRVTSLAPTVAQIISLDDDGGDWEEHTDDTALMDKKHRKTESEGSIKDKDIHREKPARPAPPKPRVQRSKTLKATGSSRDEGQRSSGVTTPPPNLKSAEGVVVIVDKGTPQASRKTSKQHSSSKRDYTTLDSSADSSPIEPHPPHAGLEASLSEAAKRGHARGKSLDLNKMIQEDMTTDVLDDLPSAVPPKPPPKPHHSPPAEYAREEGKNWPFENTNRDNEEEGQGKKGGRFRSLSTGSINTPMSPEHAHQEVELETNALLLSDQPKPKARKLKAAPRRPPPPIKPTLPDLSNYQVSETKGKTPTDEKPKDKKELQTSIKMLKEQNIILTEVNQSLEAKLFKIMEERVKLERELDMAQTQ